MSNEVSTSPEFLYGTADEGDDPVTIEAGKCILRQIHVTESPSHAINVLDGATVVFVIPANAGVGTKVDYGDVRFDTSLIIDFDASQTAGAVTAVFKPNHEGQAGGGAGLP